jgi:hypothetical protein
MADEQEWVLGEFIELPLDLIQALHQRHSYPSPLAFFIENEWIRCGWPEGIL